MQAQESSLKQKMKTKNMTTLHVRKSTGRSPLWQRGLIGLTMAFFLLGAVCQLNAQQNFIPGTIKEFKSTKTPGQGSFQTTFVVPANITKILAELWGAGGGGGSVA